VSLRANSAHAVSYHPIHQIVAYNRFVLVSHHPLCQVRAYLTFFLGYGICYVILVYFNRYKTGVSCLPFRPPSTHPLTLIVRVHSPIYPLPTLQPLFCHQSYVTLYSATNRMSPPTHVTHTYATHMHSLQAHGPTRSWTSSMPSSASCSSPLPSASRVSSAYSTSLCSSALFPARILHAPPTPHCPSRVLEQKVQPKNLS
jgi:hypothetical protein